MLILLSNLLLASIVQFPVAELGNCATMQECKIYCNNRSHQEACTIWAENNGFKSKASKKEHIRKGPGGCASRQECDNFCKKKENMDTCLDFAVKDGFMTQEEADKMRKKHPRPEEPKIDELKAKKILEEIGGPGGCANFDECDIFCSVSENEEICTNFAIKHELFKPGEVEKIKKMMNMTGPGGCKGRECEDYCDKPGHEDECFEFGKKYKLIDPEELELIESMKKREIEMERKREQEEMRHREKEQQRIWQELENIEKYKEDQSLKQFYKEFPMDTEWTPEMEQKKDEYWRQVEEQRRKDEERAKQEQLEPIEPAPLGTILYLLINLLR